MKTTFNSFLNENKNITPEYLTEVILRMIDVYLSKYTETLIKLNSGWCEEFAHDVNDIFKKAEIIDDGLFWIDNKPKYYNEFKASYIKVKSKNEYYDLDILEKYGSFINDDVKSVLLNNQMLGHSWLYYNNKHYDAETPNGVISIWDLPIYQRWLKIKK